MNERIAGLIAITIMVVAGVISLTVISLAGAGNQPWYEEVHIIDCFYNEGVPAGDSRQCVIVPPADFDF